MDKNAQNRNSASPGQARIEVLRQVLSQSEEGWKLLSHIDRHGWAVEMRDLGDTGALCLARQKCIYLNDRVEDPMLVTLLAHEAAHAQQVDRLGTRMISSYEQGRFSSVPHLIQKRLCEGDAYARQIKVADELSRRGIHAPMQSLCSRPFYRKILHHTDLPRTGPVTRQAFLSAVFWAYHTSGVLADHYDQNTIKGLHVYRMMVARLKRAGSTGTPEERKSVEGFLSGEKWTQLDLKALVPSYLQETPAQVIRHLHDHLPQVTREQAAHLSAAFRKTIPQDKRRAAARTYRRLGR